MSITIPGHELEFVDELYRWNEEGQGFTAACLCCSQHVPGEKQKTILKQLQKSQNVTNHKMTSWSKIFTLLFLTMSKCMNRLRTPPLTSLPAGDEYFCAGSRSCARSPSPSLPSECSHSPTQPEKQTTCPQTLLNKQFQ